MVGPIYGYERILVSIASSSDCGGGAGEGEGGGGGEGGGEDDEVGSRVAFAADAGTLLLAINGVAAVWSPLLAQSFLPQIKI